MVSMMIGLYDFTKQVQGLRAMHYTTFGWTYRSACYAPPALLPMRAYGMITSRSGEFKCLGALTGQAYGDQDFNLIDVTAPSIFNPNGSVSDKNPGFQGVILSLAIPQVFSGRTIIIDDFGPANAKHIDGMKRVGMVDRTFEQKFEVYADDQVEARHLITPDFMERLMVFSRHYLGRGVQCLFLGRQLHVALNIDDRFRFSHDFKAYNAKEASATIVAEIGAVCLLLEQVQTLQAAIGREGSDGADQARQMFYSQKLQSLMAMLPHLLTSWKIDSPVPFDMRDTQYLFCDSLKGLLSPRV